MIAPDSTPGRLSPTSVIIGSTLLRNRCLVTICQSGRPLARAVATNSALKFFDWAYKNGGKMAADLDYVPLPDALVAQVRATWKAQIQGAAF